jgi:branched-chain amino acid transport system substrate-binding protein
VEALVRQNHAIALVGDTAAQTGPAFAKFLNQVQVPSIGGTAQKTPLYTTDPMFFPLDDSFNVLGSSLVQAVHAAGGTSGTKVANVSCTENPACAAVNKMSATEESKAGMVPKGSYLVSSSTLDYTSECIAMKNAGVTVVVSASGEPVSIRLEKNCATQAYHPKYVVTQATDSILATGETTFYVSDGFPWTGNYPETATYHQAMSAAGATAQNGNTADTWMALTMFEEAAKNVGADPTSQDILNGLYAIQNNNLGGILPGPVSYSKGQEPREEDCYYVMMSGNHQWQSTNGMKGYCSGLTS